MTGTIVPENAGVGSTDKSVMRVNARPAGIGVRSGIVGPNDSLTSFDGYVGHAHEFEWTIAPRPVDGGIREEVPSKYRDRFEKWKSELLSTEFGREQWNKYAGNKNFILRIVVSGTRKKGAGTDKFVWDDTGRLIGATITLGSKLDEGFPNPIYYPVLNSLSLEAKAIPVNGRILAATKISHELGHVNQASAGSMKDLQLQNRLMPEYVSIFLSNGLNTRDKKLVDLAIQMGGTPVEIWESREYISEVNAMLFLNDRISGESFYCQVFNKIRWNLQTYAPGYERHFGAQPEFSGSPCWK
ncbi:MAG: hypothetical protein AB7L70_16655 [Pyrinomonadaceae bacterium]